MGIIRFAEKKIGEKRICQTHEKVAFARERKREREMESKRISARKYLLLLTHTRSAKNYYR